MGTDRSKDWASLILRLGFGGLMLLGHGLPKLQRLFGGGEIRFTEFLGLDPVINLGLATFAEFLCSILIILGFKTRLASIPIIVTMLVATFYANLGNPWLKANADGGPSKEFPLLFLMGFLAIMLLGGGYFSIDSWWRRRESL